MALTTSKILGVLSDFKNRTGPYIADSKIILKTARQNAGLGSDYFQKLPTSDIVDMGVGLRDEALEKFSSEDEKADDRKINFVV